MEPLSVGLIGLGGMGRGHLAKENALEEVRFVGVADVAPEAVRRASEEFGVKGYADHQALMDSGDVEAVLIATPHPFHAPIAIDAMKRGLHVLSEKPIAVTVGEADAMIETARQTGVQLGVMFQTRTGPIYRRARELLTSGAIGRIYRSTIVATHWFRTQGYYDSGSWRGTWTGEGGGVLMNQAPHSLDMFIWLGGMPRRVQARAGTRGHRIEVEDTVEALLDYEPGHTGYLYTTTSEWPGEDRYEFVGDRGKLVITDRTLRLYHMNQPLEDEIASDAMWGKPSGAWGDVDVESAPTGHAEVVKQFARAIRQGEPLVASGVDGRNALELANALLLSGFEDRPVQLPIDRAEYDRFLARKREESRAS